MSQTNEQQAKQSIEQNYESQRCAILDSLPVILFVLDEDGKYIEIISAVESQLYREEDKLLGKYLHDIFDRKTATLFLEAIQDTLQHNKVNKLEYELDVIKGHSYFSGRLSPMDYEVDGRRVVLFAAIDVTEQKRKDMQLQHSMKMDAVGQLTGGIAHDFNNLLSIIIGNLDYLKSRVQHDEDSQRLIDRALSASTRAGDLIKQLLVFARHQQGDVIPVDVNTIISMMNELIMHSTPEGIELRQDLAENLWQTKMDPGEFENVLLNIVNNAYDAMPEGGTLTIETRNVLLSETDTRGRDKWSAGEYVLLCIMDTGCGMTPEVRAKALEPFFTTRGIGTGRGLGLSIVYGFMLSIDGFLYIESETGKGSSVCLYLPRLAATGENAEDISPASDAGTEEPEVNTILVVDDEMELLALAQEQIEDLGYKVYAASSGSQALQLLAEHEDIDLLFSDVIMPDNMNGYELAEKAIELRPGLKILLASGFTSEVMQQKGLASFEAVTLQKPYRYEELSSKLTEVLNS